MIVCVLNMLVSLLVSWDAANKQTKKGKFN